MSRPTFRPSLERLAARELFAGNVDLNLTSDGDLEITGDNEANGIEVTRLGDGRFQVTGLSQGGAPTLIEGQTRQIVSNVTRHVEIDTRDGNDAVRVTATSLYQQVIIGDLDIETGDGADLVVIEKTVTRGRTDVNMGDDADRLLIKASRSYGITEIEMGLDDANDSVDLQYFWAFGDLEIDTGAGRDLVSLFDVTSEEETSIETGSDRDTVSLQLVNVKDRLYADLGGGDDTLHAAYVTAASTDVDGGSGVDQLHVYWSGTQDTNDWDLSQVSSFEYRYRHLI